MCVCVCVAVRISRPGEWREGSPAFCALQALYLRCLGQSRNRIFEQLLSQWRHAAQDMTCADASALLLPPRPRFSGGDDMEAEDEQTLFNSLLAKIPDRLEDLQDLVAAQAAGAKG